MGKTDWTEAMDARLRELHAKGYSFSGIADVMSAEFHVKLSKNAAIGRGHRLKVPARKKATQPKPSAQTVPELPEYEPEVIVQPPRWEVTLPKPEAGRVSIWELRQGICHYPLGERPPYAYCGLKTSQGPYCSQHRRVMHGPRIGAR